MGGGCSFEVDALSIPLEGQLIFTLKRSRVFMWVQAHTGPVCSLSSDIELDI